LNEAWDLLRSSVASRRTGEILQADLDPRPHDPDGAHAMCARFTVLSDTPIASAIAGWGHPEATPAH
jgi:hypothetical protein